MEEPLSSLLVCPACRSMLVWSIANRPKCSTCATPFEFRDGVIALVANGTEAEWERTESKLRAYLRAEPDREQALRTTPHDDLNPADLFFLSLLLEEEGRHAESESCAEMAVRGCYLPEYLAAVDAQLDFVASRVCGLDATVVDVASGRGALVRRLLSNPPATFVASDLSPLVLRHMRSRFEAARIGPQPVFVAFDAAAIPFADKGVDVVTTHLGLTNLPDPSSALLELRRVTRGRLFAVCHFVADDDANLSALRGMTDLSMFTAHGCLDAFRRAGWDATLEHEVRAPAAPTPVGELIEGARIDEFPLIETELNWCVLSAT